MQRLGPAFPAAPAGSVPGALRRARCYPALQRALGRALLALRPETVHLILAPSFFAYAPFLGRLPYPVVLTLAGEMRYVRHFYGAAKRLAVRYAVARADALVVCSADEMLNLAAVAPRAVSRAVLLDNFTDVARFAPAPRKEPLVTFAARLHPEKGALLYLDAIARVREAHPQARFALMGEGEEGTAVQRRLRELGLVGSVQRGYATDLAPLFARSLVFVSCQRHENLGSSSLLERWPRATPSWLRTWARPGASSTAPWGTASRPTRRPSPGPSGACWRTAPWRGDWGGRPGASAGPLRPRPLRLPAPGGVRAARRRRAGQIV